MGNNPDDLNNTNSLVGWDDLTLAANTTINSVGLSIVNSYKNFINDGVIDQTGSLLELISTVDSIINNGEINAGGSLDIYASTFINNNTLIENGSMDIGTGQYDSATNVVNESTGTWEVNDAYVDGDTATITNHGLVETTGANAYSTVNVPMTNDATILVSSGTLDFGAELNGKGMITISTT